MAAPWYECSGPTLDDAYKEFKNFKIDNIIVPPSIVNRCIQYEYTKYGSFGSWRGWVSFARRNIVQECNDEFTHLNKLVSKLKGNKIILNWVNDRLYRPTDGLRYNQVQDEFNELKE
jgi:hypothetical protein